MTRKTPRPAVLVADDDAGVRRYLQTALEHFGFRVQACSNGTAAIRKAKSGRFALAILDYWMGVPNGFEVLMRLRTDGVRVPVILTSSELPDHVREHCEAERFAIILAKPFTLEDLQKAVDRALGRH